MTEKFPTLMKEIDIWYKSRKQRKSQTRWTQRGWHQNMLSLRCKVLKTWENHKGSKSKAASYIPGRSLPCYGRLHNWTLHNTYCIRLCYQDTDSKQLHLIETSKQFLLKKPHMDLLRLTSSEGQHWGSSLKGTSGIQGETEVSSIKVGAGG